MEDYTTPKSWGPHFWYIMRCTAYNYPTNPSREDIANTKTFYSIIQHILPCEICKYTYKQHFAKHPIDRYLSTKKKLIEWVEIMCAETKKIIRDRRVKIINTAYDSSDEESSPRQAHKHARGSNSRSKKNIDLEYERPVVGQPANPNARSQYQPRSGDPRAIQPSTPMPVSKSTREPRGSSRINLTGIDNENNARDLNMNNIQQFSIQPVKPSKTRDSRVPTPIPVPVPMPMPIPNQRGINDNIQRFQQRNQQSNTNIPQNSNQIAMQQALDNALQQALNANAKKQSSKVAIMNKPHDININNNNHKNHSSANTLMQARNINVQMPVTNNINEIGNQSKTKKNSHAHNQAIQKQITDALLVNNQIHNTRQPKNAIVSDARGQQSNNARPNTVFLSDRLTLTKRCKKCDF